MINSQLTIVVSKQEGKRYWQPEDHNARHGLSLSSSCCSFEKAFVLGVLLYTWKRARDTPQGRERTDAKNCRSKTQSLYGMANSCPCPVSDEFGQGHGPIAEPGELGYISPMNNDWHNCPAVERNQERVSGAWVFCGTRIPVRALFENLEDGASIDDVFEWFPGVTRRQVESVLEHVSAGLSCEMVG